MKRDTMTILPAMAMLGGLALAGCAGSASGGTTISSPIPPSASPVSATASSAAPRLTESNPPGDIPDTQVYVRYAPPGSHFTVTVPQGWARTVTAAGVTFTDKLNTISLQELASAAAPTPASVTATVIPQLRQQIPAFSPGTVTAATRTAGAVVLLTFQGDSAPNPVTNKVIRDAFERYAFWNAGHQVIVTVSGPVSADNVDPWKIVSNSLRWQ